MSGIIKNKTELLKLGREKKERRKVEFLINLVEDALRFAQPSSFMEKAIEFNEHTLTYGKETLELSEERKYVLLSIGKAAETMAKWFNLKFPFPFKQVIISSPDEPSEEVKEIPNCLFFKGGHPVPNKNSLRSARKAIETLKSLEEGDVCFVLISGGGSALFELPIVKLENYTKLMKLLLSCGATIHEINTIRKHFSLVKGGKLASYTQATIYSFIISDVPGNDPSYIASGPTVMDETTWEDCERIVKRYRLKKYLPSEVKKILLDKKAREKYETPKEKEKFKKVHNTIIGSNETVLRYIQEKIEKNENVETEILSYNIEGEAQKIGKRLAKKRGEKHPCAYLWGGETTVKLPKNKKKIGKGGRNQELALAFALNKTANKGAYLVQFGTDGIDGNSEATGAIIGPFTINSKDRKKEAKRYLKNHDSNTFFQKNGGEIITGYTGTNVMDIGVLVLDEK